MISNPSLQVSVAMCTYNGARFIEEQLWSIFRQTLLPREIVVSDDGSSDETLKLVEKTYKQASETVNGVSGIALKVIRNPSPLGVTSNFEQAISNCTYTLIALCDQDDVWQKNRLEIMVNKFEQQPELDLLHHDSDLVDQCLKPFGYSTFDSLRFSKSEKQKIRNQQAFEVLIRRNVVTGATVIFKRSLFEISSPFPKFWLHDEWLAIVASTHGRLDFLDAKLIQYRQHSSNAVGAKKRNMRYMIVRMLYPRTERNQVLLNRATVLYEFLFSRNRHSDFTYLAGQKLLHEKFRSSLSQMRIMRVLPILGELKTGNYKRYGLGFQDVIRDLFQSSR